MLVKFRRWTFGYDVAAMFAGTRTEINHVVGSKHDVFIMFHHQHTVTNRGKFLQGFYQALIVALMQSDARLI